MPVWATYPACAAVHTEWILMACVVHKWWVMGSGQVMAWSYRLCTYLHPALAGAAFRGSLHRPVKHLNLTLLNVALHVVLKYLPAAQTRL